MYAKIAVLPGDGIGPEVAAEAVNVLKQVADCFGHKFNFEEYPIGRAAQKASGDILPDSTLEACRKADSVLLGALTVGESRDETLFHGEIDRGLMAIKRALGMIVSMRQIKPHPALRALSPLRPEMLEGVDMLIVRCLGVQARMPDTPCDGETIAIVADAACRMARMRRHHVTAVDSAMLGDGSHPWREVPARIAGNYMDVQLDVMPVDACMQQILFDPRNLDVLMADNMLGAALASQATTLVGAPALLPMGARGIGHMGVYGSVAGPMFDHTGIESANPIGAILSAAMMLRYSFNLEREAEAIEYAVDSALGSGMRTADIAAPGERVISTHAMGEAIAAWICQRASQSTRSIRAEE